MASETLSQQEIDQLFDGPAGASNPRSSGRPGASEVQVYDFRRPSRISKDRMRSLEAMYGLLAKSIESWLMSRVRTGVEVQLLEVQQFSFGEFVLSLPTPCASFVFDIGEPGGHQGVIDFGSEFAFFLVDRLLGGSGPAVTPDRALTPLERLIVRLAADRIAGLLADIWQDHAHLDLKLSRFESIPDMLQIVNREDPVLVANLEVTAGETKSALLLCLSFSVLENFFTSSSTRRVHATRLTAAESEADRQAIERSLYRARIPVQVRLREFRLSMRELAELRPGSVLLTGHAADSEALVYVGGQERYRAQTRRVGQRLAARITDLIEADSGNPRPRMREVEE